MKKIRRVLLTTSLPARTTWQNISWVASIVCTTIAAGGFATAVLLQNLQGAQWGAVPRLALPSALMVATLTIFVSMIVGGLLSPKSRLLFSILFALLGVMSAMMIR